MTLPPTPPPETLAEVPPISCSTRPTPSSPLGVFPGPGGLEAVAPGASLLAQVPPRMPRRELPPVERTVGWVLVTALQFDGDPTVLAGLVDELELVSDTVPMTKAQRRLLNRATQVLADRCAIQAARAVA